MGANPTRFTKIGDNMKRDMLWTAGMSFGITFLVNLRAGLLEAFLTAAVVGIIAVCAVWVMRKLKI